VGENASPSISEVTMKEPSLRRHLELAFRRKLFKLIDQYLNFPQDATLGEIIRTLVNFADLVSALDRSLEITGAVSNTPTWQTSAQHSIPGVGMNRALRKEVKCLVMGSRET
jgi:hypothetical protein